MQTTPTRIFSFICLAMITACNVAPAGEPTPPAPAALMETAQPVDDAATPTAVGEIRLWVDENTPQELVNMLDLDVTMARSEKEAGVVLRALAPGEDLPVVGVWVYTAAVHFPTITDEITLSVVRKAWNGKGGKPFTRFMIGEAHGLGAWLGEGETDASVETTTGDFTGEAWKKADTLAIFPFHWLEPHWKVLRVDGSSPYDDDFDPLTHPLTARYGLAGAPQAVRTLMQQVDEPVSNYDAELLSTVVLTGTTALVRHTAQRMEEYGVDYPAKEIGAWLRSADLLHVSNEVPFYSDCPPADPVRLEARFCSDPSYFALFEEIGVDVVELTGNHVLDWGIPAFEETLHLYEGEQLPYYGGGWNETDAAKPFLWEHNGNRIALIGCNAMGPEHILATDVQPGPGRCDMEELKTRINELKTQGYLPVVTFQHFELDDFKPQSGQRVDMLEAASAGAVIVSGSQAHYPQTFTFVDHTFVHFGLGNLFFDQAEGNQKKAFIDRHIFYNSRYLGVELVTIMIEDYAQPRWMTAAEREKLLKGIFDAAIW